MDRTRVSPVDHVETTDVFGDAMSDLFDRWREANPDSPPTAFVSLAQQATVAQRSLLAPVTQLPAALGTDTDVWFADFWKTYPRRVGKGAARRAWAAAVRKTGDPAVVLVGARRYAADPNLPEPQFIPHPATWLNGERWADGPLPARRVQASRTTRALVGLAQHSTARALPALPTGR